MLIALFNVYNPMSLLDVQVWSEDLSKGKLNINFELKGSSSEPSLSQLIINN